MADVYGTATLTATSTLSAVGSVAGVGSLFNPKPGTSPEAIDFADGTNTALDAARGDPGSVDLWFSVASTGSEYLTLTWAGAFDVGLEVWAAPEDGVVTSVDDITLLADGPGPTLMVDTGEDQLYFLRIYPLDDANNAGTGTLSWATSARPDGTLDLEVDPVAYDTPSWLRVSVLSATAGGLVQFYVDGVFVFEEEASDMGTLVGITVPIPEVVVGMHTLLAEDVGTGQTDTEPFEVQIFTTDPGTDPPPLGPTTPPSTDDVVRWVFEEVLPVGSTGTGEIYTFPNNPSQMSTPHAPRVIATDHTTAPDGQPILWEGVGAPVEWVVEGFCFTQAHAEALEHWQSQNRRFWAVDHLQRAWAVTFETLDWTPVRDTGSRWSARYRIKLFIYDGPVVLS